MNKPSDKCGFEEFGVQVDVWVVPAGKIFLFYLKTQAAKDWVAEHVNDDAQFFGDALVVEDRYVGALAAGMANEGGLLVQ